LPRYRAICPASSTASQPDWQKLPGDSRLAAVDQPGVYPYGPPSRGGTPTRLRS